MSAGWRIELLGDFRVTWGGQPLPGFRRQRTALLLAYLALRCGQGPAPRDVLMEALWPEGDPELSRTNLRTVLHALRRQLELPDQPGAPPHSVLSADTATISLDSAAVTTDVAEFHAALRSAAGAPDPARRIQSLAAAVALYRGELLPGFYEPWVLPEREHLATAYLDALQQLAMAREQAGDLEGAVAAARQAVLTDPLREEAHYTVMRLYAALGQPSACLQQYEELERLLDEELGETPSTEARARAEELRESARTVVVARRSPPPAMPSSLIVGAPVAPPSPRSPEPDDAVGSTSRVPLQLTRFFGREEEIARLSELLTSDVTRLVTLTGPGGSGKTRLAVAVAGRLQEQWGHAVAVVPLADLDEGARLPDAVADALELARTPERSPLEQVVEHLRGQPWLLVLDNFEQLVESGALLVRALLERVPTLTLLVTSRQRLGVSGEQELALLPLPTPGSGVQVFRCSGVQEDQFQTPEHLNTRTPEYLLQYPSVALFVDRAQAARADFRLTSENARAVAELCERLDGLPLAIELAAARAAVLSPAEMLAHLEQRFAFLVSRQRDMPSRHRTLRAAIEGSCQLLDPPLQQFFARLSVFRGGWTLEAAAAVAGHGEWVGTREMSGGVGDDRGTLAPAPTSNRHLLSATLDCLEQLRDSSLVLVEEVAGAVRYRLLETLREYAGEQLSASGELAAIRDRHRDWCQQHATQFAAAANGPQQGVWLRRVEAEMDNMRAALAWCQEAADTSDAAALAGLRLAEALWWWWMRRGSPAEGQFWLEGALARAPEAPPAARASALLQASHLTYARGDRERAWSFLQSAYREQEKAVALVREAGDQRGVADAVLALADIAQYLTTGETAWAHGTEARQLMQALGEPVGLARSLEMLAGIALRRLDVQAARPLLEELLAICRQLDDPDRLIHALEQSGHLARDEGGCSQARALYQESLRLCREWDYPYPLAQSLEDLAVLAGREGQAERASRVLGAAEAFCERLGLRPPLGAPPEYERTVTEGRAALGEAAFAVAWAQGRAMSLEQAVEYALSAE
jgi:predicted ATPase/DNA-binding SARP family transcriptional activator